MTERTNTTDANTPRANGNAFVRANTDHQANVRLREQLANQRERARVASEHQLAERTQRAEHKIAIADLRERVANTRSARRERYRTTRDAVALAALYRRATEAGASAYLKAQINGSIEMRTLRLATMLKVSLYVGIPVFLAFAAWSTAGVQSGVVRALRIPDGTFGWAASWGVEPALATIVAMIIIGRAILKSSGGKTDWQANTINGAALALSLALNVYGGWPTTPVTTWEYIATALPHSIGPLGCAATAYLLGLFERYISDAHPEVGAKHIDQLGLDIRQPNISMLGQANSAANGEHQANGDQSIERRPVQRTANSPANTEQSIERQAANSAANGEHQANGEQPAIEQRTANSPANTERLAIEQHGTRIEPTLADIVPPPVRGTGITPEVIERLDAELPDWRTNIPSARVVAKVLGYRSSSTGSRIRNALVVLADDDLSGKE